MTQFSVGHALRSHAAAFGLCNTDTMPTSRPICEEAKERFQCAAWEVD